MNELVRMQYIDAMGIDMFVPRRQLLNAKISTVCELPVRKSTGAGTNHIATDVVPGTGILVEQLQPSSSKSSGAAVQSILGDFESAGKKANVSSKAEERPGIHADQSLNPTDISDLVNRHVPKSKADFSLGLWRIGDHLQIIDSRSRGDALPTEALLRNILRAHGCISSPLHLPPQEIINWPLGSEPSSTHSRDSDDDQSWSAAHEMLMSFLEGRLLSKPVKIFWIMGEDALKVVMGEELEFNDCVFKSISIDSFAAEALVLPSLRECLNVPLNKKTLWSAVDSFLRQYAFPSSEKD